MEFFDRLSTSFSTFLRLVSEELKEVGKNIETFWTGLMQYLYDAYTSVSVVIHQYTDQMMRWIEPRPLDALTLTWCAIGFAAALWVVRSRHMPMPNTSSAMWSFVVLGATLCLVGLGFDLAGRTILPVESPLLVGTNGSLLAVLGVVTHRTTT